ncbi:MAG TPA: ABC transporter permease [Chloroflexota bacterium]|nr:ABC transporter permease [Chloroflexota bacterium]
MEITTGPAQDTPDPPPASTGHPLGRISIRRPSASATIWIATLALFLVSAGVQPQSLSFGSLAGMLPFAAILAVVAAGQTLIIQQAGIDLSVPGMISLGVVMLTRIPNGDESKLPVALGLCGVALVGAGLLSGLIVNRIGITPIVTTLGMNAMLFGAVIFISGGTPRDTTALLQGLVTDTFLGLGHVVWIALLVIVLVDVLVKRTVQGRRFEAVGANRAAARAAGFPSVRYEIGAYAGAGLLYFVGSILLAGVVKTPSAFQGNNYLLPSVAAVVLGGTSLLGGAGSVIATAGGALFLTQLQQLLRTTDLNAGVVLIVQALAIAVGVGVNSIRGAVLWGGIFGSTPKPRIGREGQNISG